MHRGKEWLMRAGLVIATVTAGLPFQDIESGQRAAGATIFGGDVDCADGVEPAHDAYRFDAIVVLGAGQVSATGGRPEPSYLGRMRWDAAARLYVELAAPLIVAANGAGASAEIEHLQRAYQEVTGNDTPIPDEAILVGNHAINTATEAAEVATIAKTHGIQRALVVTNEFHRRRAAAFLCANRIPTSSVAAEQVILEGSPERADEFTALYDSETMDWIKTKEAAELALFIVDPQGFVPTVIRRIIPP